MVVHRDRERLLRPILADHIPIEQLEDTLRRRNAARGVGPLGADRLLFIDDLAAQIDTLVADIHRARAGNQPPDVFLALSAE